MRSKPCKKKVVQTTELGCAAESKLATRLLLAPCAPHLSRRSLWWRLDLRLDVWLVGLWQRLCATTTTTSTTATTEVAVTNSRNISRGHQSMVVNISTVSVSMVANISRGHQSMVLVVNISCVSVSMVLE